MRRRTEDREEGLKSERKRQLERERLERQRNGGDGEGGREGLAKFSLFENFCSSNRPWHWATSRRRLAGLKLD